ncbi:MAG: VCBS repeat-containing protein, partial [Bacteroidota bacterium]
MTIKNLLVLAFLLGASLGFGQFGEAKTIMNCQLCSPSDVLSVDLDNDSDLDILVSSYSDNKVVWYENLGMGDFANQRTISTEFDRITSVTAGDMDNDGDNDVVATSWEEGKLILYENIGDMLFSEGIVITNGISWAKSVSLSDLDNDGDLDVISPS